ncbi:replication protein [Yersinia massiliensis]|uniref:replication protein n=1 Tax=Yersinia massiliensis TaxID=419257 RepID=UPI001CFD8FEB|nr:replication protein [Yersinia massiliensis]MCB5318655.1 replication protein [Yersinia massiliensis]
MNVVRHISDYQKPHLEVVERRVADTDDGYTRIANELLEAIAGADLTARQLKVMIAVIRKTYGYQKKLDRIADIQIADITGLSRQNVNKAKKELLSMHCLMMDGNKIGPNKDLSEWQSSKCLQKDNFVSKLKTISVSKLETVEVSKMETHKRNTLNKKETTPKSPEGTLVDEDKSKTKQPVSSKFTFDRERFKETWNRKANKHGLPRIVSISTTTEKGLKRLYESHLKHCRETKRIPRDMDTFINGYIEFGYTPSSFAMGENPAGKKYGIDTALTQRIIDQVISQEA